MNVYYLIFLILLLINIIVSVIILYNQPKIKEGLVKNTQPPQTRQPTYAATVPRLPISV